MSTGNPPLQLRITPERRALWQAKADKAGLTLTDWARDRLDQADCVNPRSAYDQRLHHIGGGKRFTGPDPKPPKK